MTFDKKKAIEERRAKLIVNPNAVYWNWTSTDETALDMERILEYRFLMINQDPRTIHRIKDRISEYLENTREINGLLTGVCQAPNKIDYHYRLLKLKSLKGPRDLIGCPSTIYNGRVVRDKRLTDHASDDGLILYAKGKIEDILKVDLP